MIERWSRRPVAKLSIASTVSPRASSISTTCEPTWPAPPVTKTFIVPIRSLAVSLRGERSVSSTIRRNSCGPVMEALMPQFEAQQAPGLAREALGACRNSRG